MFTIRNCFIAILALLFPVVSLAGQQHLCTCSQKTVVGTYAVTAEGTTMMTLADGTQMPVPLASLTIVSIDPDGEASSSGYIAIGDQIMRFGIEPDDPAMESTITVNPDCTGMEEVSIQHGELNVETKSELIVQKGGNEISSIMIEGGPLGAPTVTGRWKKISRIHDINHPLMGWGIRVVGTYVTSQSGVSMIPDAGPAPGAVLGRASIRHDRSFEFSGTAMAAGTYMPFTLSDGVWEKNDLPFTYTTRGSIMAGGVQYFGELEYWMVALDGGNEFWGIALSEPSGVPVALMTAKRVSLRPADLE